MKLTLTDDDGVVIETWYVADEEYKPAQVKSAIESAVAAYADIDEYTRLALDFGKTAEQHLR